MATLQKDRGMTIPKPVKNQYSHNTALPNLLKNNEYLND